MGGLRSLTRKLILSGTTGAVTSFIAQKYNYDFSVIEGMRQTIIASLPVLMLEGHLPEEKDESYLKRFVDWTGNSPYIFPLANAGLLSSLYFLGGSGMEYLTKSDVSQGFTAVNGGLIGLISGIYASTKARHS